MSDLLAAIVSAAVGAIVGSAATVWLASIRWRRVQVRAHRARWDDPWETFANPPASAFACADELANETAGESLYVKIVNRSNRDVEVTHIWLATDPVAYPVPRGSELPVRIRPDETDEVWFNIDALPPGGKLERLARVRLSSGKTIRSRLNKTVPPFGAVARAQG